jgi:hypothetical protein
MKTANISVGKAGLWAETQNLPATKLELYQLAFAVQCYNYNAYVLITAP